MKVALYYPWIYLRSGCERTIAELLARSRHDWTVITNRFEPESTYPEIPPDRVIELPRVSVERSFSRVVHAAWRISRQKLPLSDCQALVIFCEGIGDFAVFQNSDVPLLCLCFTPLRAAFDPLYQERYLSMIGGGWKRRFLLNAFAAGFRFVDRFAWRKYRRIYAISAEVRERIARGRLAKAKDVGLLYPGVDTSAAICSTTCDPVFLIPGRIMWTKNLELGIDAFQLLLGRRPDFAHFKLLIAGFVDLKSRPYIEALKHRAVACPQIEFIEAPSDPELAALYERCFAIVYPPFNEDWGLFPLEGMLRSKPVIATNRGGPRETVLDGQTGLLVEPTPASFAQSMETLVDRPELAAGMGAAGRLHARRFDWKFLCEGIDDAVDELCGASPNGVSIHARELA